MTESSDFENARDRIKAYILDNALLPQLMVEAQFSSRTTFYSAFDEDILNEEQLTPRQRIIWQKAMSMMESSESLLAKALRVISK